jgi:DNA-binding MarR family transcriptional regulator
VERTYPEGDRRYQSLVLSPTGKKLVPILADLADQNDREFFGALTPDQRAELASVLQQIVRRQGWKDVPTT